MINAAPEVLTQIRAVPALQPPAGAPRGTPIAAVMVTNGDIDHIAGLLSLRESQPFTLYATADILAVLGQNRVFDVLADGVVERRTIRLDEPFVLVPGIEARPFAVPGKAALYLEGGDVAIGGEGEATIGVELSAGGRSAFYIPGCAHLSEGLAKRLAGAELVLFDGTLWEDEEMIAAGLGGKTGRRMGHMPMSGPEGTLAAFARLDVGRKVFVHINNTNPVLIENSPERQKVEAAGWEVAHDGMEITL